jgi:hypothetical protein
MKYATTTGGSFRKSVFSGENILLLTSDSLLAFNKLKQAQTDLPNCHSLIAPNGLSNASKPSIASKDALNHSELFTAASEEAIHFYNAHTQALITHPSPIKIHKLIATYKNLIFLASPLMEYSCISKETGMPTKGLRSTISLFNTLTSNFDFVHYIEEEKVIDMAITASGKLIVVCKKSYTIFDTKKLAMAPYTSKL